MSKYLEKVFGSKSGSISLPVSEYAVFVSAKQEECRGDRVSCRTKTFEISTHLIQPGDERDEFLSDGDSHLGGNWDGSKCHLMKIYRIKAESLAQAEQLALERYLHGDNSASTSSNDQLRTTLPKKGWRFRIFGR